MPLRPFPFSFSWGAACRRAPPFNFSNRGLLPLRFRKLFLPKAGPETHQDRPLCVVRRIACGGEVCVGRRGEVCTERRRGEPATRGAAGALARIRVWGAGCGAAVVRADIVWFCVVENTPSLWHFVSEWSSFSVNGFVILFMNNYEYKPDVLKQLNGEYNVNNIHISGQKRYSNDADTRDKRKERRTLHD